MVWVRTPEAIQDVVDQAPKAKHYYSDGFDAYQWLWYHLGRYEISKGKADTILSKPIMPNSVIIWLAWLANHVVFLGVLMPLNTHYAYLFLPLTPGNFISNAFQIMLHTLWTSLAHDI